jgi:hypothetical protein
MICGRRFVVKGDEKLIDRTHKIFKIISRNHINPVNLVSSFLRAAIQLGDNKLFVAQRLGGG